ncbi:MAG: hypothetical protein RL527_1666, partial [Planctomycetota bacterium]
MTMSTRMLGSFVRPVLVLVCLGSTGAPPSQQVEPKPAVEKCPSLRFLNPDPAPTPAPKQADIE